MAMACKLTQDTGVLDGMRSDGLLPTLEQGFEAFGKVRLVDAKHRGEHFLIRIPEIFGVHGLQYGEGVNV